MKAKLEKYGEYIFLFLIIFIVLFLTHFPTLYLWLKTPPGYWFTGISSIFDPWDNHFYLFQMLNGKEGSWLAVNAGNPDRITQTPAYLFYLLLGHLADLIRLPITVVFHLSAILLNIILFCVVYTLAKKIFVEKFWRVLAVYLTFLGGGVGWMVFGKLGFPDISIPDGTVFNSLTLPHFVLDQTLFVLILMMYATRKRLLIILLCSLALGLIHPTSLGAVAFILTFLSAWLLLKNKLQTEMALNLGTIYLSTIFIFFFFYFLIADSHFGRTWLFEKIVGAAPPLVYLISYFPLSILSLWAVFRIQKKEYFSMFLFSWFIAQFPLIYAPGYLHRLAMKGWFISLAFLSTLSLKEIKNTTIAIYIGLMVVFGPLILTYFRLMYASPSYLIDSWYYFPLEEKEAFEWLAKNSPRYSVVLISPKEATALITVSLNRPFHLPVGGLNPYHEENEQLTESFFRGVQTDPRSFVKNRSIEYVYFGPAERILAGKEKLNYSFLIPVYQNSKVIIYKTKIV